MDKKVIKILLNIPKYYNHFDNNQVVLGKLNEKYHSGDPVKIWMEAIEITNDMAAIEKGRYDMFLNIGNNWHEAKRYAVKKMVVYILENTTPNISETDKDEMRRMRNDLASLSYEYNTEELSCEFAAEPLQQTISYKKYMRECIACFVKEAEEYEYDTLLLITKIVQDINIKTDGYVNNEYIKCTELLHKSLEHKKKIESVNNPDDKTFSKEQYEKSKIKNTFWLKAMYALWKNNTYKEDMKATKVDFCIAFLAVLLYNNEYNKKGERNVFYNMLKDLFNIDVSKQERQTIDGYIVSNTYIFTDWDGSGGIMKRRRQIAMDISIKKKQLEDTSLKNM